MTIFEYKNEYILQREIGGSNVERFKELMNTIAWNLITQTLNPNESYSIFIEKFIKIYDQAFPLQKNQNKREESSQYLDYKGDLKIKEKTAPL